MTQQQTVVVNKRGHAVKVIISAWLLAGTLDITAAAIYYPLTYKFKLILLFQNIASGVFGDKAFAGGMVMAALGLVFHYLIALIWTISFFLIFPRIRILSGNRFVTGMAYGIFVWLVMNLIVVPLSKANRPTFHPGQILISATFLMFCIGLPISVIVGKYYSRNRVQEASNLK